MLANYLDFHCWLEPSRLCWVLDYLVASLMRCSSAAHLHFLHWNCWAPNALYYCTLYQVNKQIISYFDMKYSHETLLSFKTSNGVLWSLEGSEEIKCGVYIGFQTGSTWIFKVRDFQIKKWSNILSKRRARRIWKFFYKWDQRHLFFCNK